MKSISLKMSKNFKIEPLCKNNVYELENNSAMVDIECEVDSTLTYKMHISHGGTKSFVVMTKNEGSISTMLTAPILNSNGVYYIQIEGIKTDFRIVSNQIRFEAGSFINAESIPTPSQQGVIDQILIRLDTAEGDIDDLEEDVAGLTTSVGAKADKSYVDTQLDLKQNVSDMTHYTTNTQASQLTYSLFNVPTIIASEYSIVKSYSVGDYCRTRQMNGGVSYWRLFRCLQDCKNKSPLYEAYQDYWEEVKVGTELGSKQNTLVSGTNIKTINGVSLLGSGNIDIQGGGSSDVTKAYVDQQDDAIRASIPTDVSDLNNDSGYLTPNTVGQYVPTKTSDLTNDSDFTTTEAVAGQLDLKQNVSDMAEYAKLTDIPSVPTKTSQLTNDSDFTTTEQVATQLDTKQNVLTAGTNITIVDDVISSTASGGSTVTMSDNANAGVDLTVDGTSRTLAKSSELATVNDALLELTTTVGNKSDKSNTVFTVNNIAPVNGNVTVPTGTPQEYDQLVEDVANLNSKFGKKLGKNLFNPATEVNGYISNGVLRPHSNWTSSDYIDVSACNDIYLSLRFPNGNRGGVSFFFLNTYDENKTLISYVSQKPNPLTIESGVKYIRFAYESGIGYSEPQVESGTAMTEYEEYHESDILVNSTYQDIKKWAGKKWCVIGDSLTEANQRTTKHYHDYIADQTGISVTNMGVSSTGYKRSDGSGKAFYQRVQNFNPNHDVVTIFGSGNDLGGGLVLGTPTDTTTDTVCGCVNITIDRLIAIKPTISLGIVSPTPWIDSQPNNPNNAMSLYVNALKTICEYRSIPFLDLYHCSNLRPWTEEGRTACYSKDDGDGTHPDENGHALITPRFKAFLETLLFY